MACSHNKLCPHRASHSKCRNDVANGICKPPSAVRVELHLSLRGVDAEEFNKFLSRNGGKIPVAGFSGK